MRLVISNDGSARCLYTESIELASVGTLEIARASHVEPDSAGRWTADLAPAGGPELGPFDTRSAALAAEIEWLETHRL